MRPEMVTEKG